MESEGSNYIIAATMLPYVPATELADYKNAPDASIVVAKVEGKAKSGRKVNKALSKRVSTGTKHTIGGVNVLT